MKREMIRGKRRTYTGFNDKYNQKIYVGDTILNPAGMAFKVTAKDALDWKKNYDENGFDTGRDVEKCKEEGQ